MFSLTFFHAKSKEAYTHTFTEFNVKCPSSVGTGRIYEERATTARRPIRQDESIAEPLLIRVKMVCIFYEYKERREEVLSGGTR